MTQTSTHATPKNDTAQPVMTTLSVIRSHHPCADGWTKLLAHLGKTAADDEPLSLLTLLDSNGRIDALWCLRVRPDLSGLWRLYAVDCARQVQHLMTDARLIAALDVAERHARGMATDEELKVAGDEAWMTFNGENEVSWAALSVTINRSFEAALATANDAAISELDCSWQSTRLRQYLSGDILL